MFTGERTAADGGRRARQPLSATAGGVWLVPVAPGALQTEHNVKWHHRTLVPTTPCRGVSLLRETDKDFLITQLIRHIEDLHMSKVKASSDRRSGEHMASDPPTYGSCLELVRVQRHHCSNQLRMLTHRWKKLGLPHSAPCRTDVQISGHSQQGFKANSPLKITPTQTGPTLRDTKRGHEDRTNGSQICNTQIPEVKANDMYDTAASPQLPSDYSDLSHQKKESVQISKRGAPVDLNFRPEPFEKDLDCSTETAQVYPEVLPAPLKRLDCSQASSTSCREEQAKTFLTPVVARLMELERLQSATVQKERAASARSRPGTSNRGTRNTSRPRRGALQGPRTHGSVTPFPNSLELHRTGATGSKL
ncbi:uncharacterized protein LOC143475169 isoform X2 [Brachyhypopomus gauderio]|uniref:uncharacterized protein LOC143475169 isoform X2 n=1 Tax=Brachyhypopomus gauderio TaxID=698409 RepID=UPI0040436D1B